MINPRFIDWLRTQVAGTSWQDDAEQLIAAAAPDEPEYSPPAPANNWPEED